MPPEVFFEPAAYPFEKLEFRLAHLVIMVWQDAVVRHRINKSAQRIDLIGLAEFFLADDRSAAQAWNRSFSWSASVVIASPSSVQTFCLRPVVVPIAPQYPPPAARCAGGFSGEGRCLKYKRNKSFGPEHIGLIGRAEIVQTLGFFLLGGEKEKQGGQQRQGEPGH